MAGFKYSTRFDIRYIRGVDVWAVGFFGLVDDSGKAISFSEWATLAQDRAGWLKLVTKVPFGIGKLQLRPPRCDTRVTPEEKRRFLARRAQETEQRRAFLMQKQTLERPMSGSKFIS